MPKQITRVSRDCFRLKPWAIAVSYANLHYLVTILHLVTFQGRVHMHVRLWIVFKALIAKAVQAKIDTNFRATFKVTVKICFLSSGHGIYPVVRALPHRILVQLNPPEDRYCYACLYIFHFHSMQSYISPALYLPGEVLSLFASCFTLSLVVTNYR